MNSMEQENKVIFPKQDTYFYGLMNHQGKELPRSYKWFKRLNRFFMIPLYRLRILPLFGIGFFILMITTIGRRTGKTRRNPLEFHKIDNVIHISAGRGEKTDWVRNMRANPDKVKVQIGFRSFHARVEFVDDLNDKIKFVEWMIKNITSEAKIGFGWNPKEDKIENSDFTSLAEFLTIVRLYKKVKINNKL